VQVPLTPPPVGAASIFCAHRQHGLRRWRWNGTGGVDFLPHHHTSSSVRSAGKHDDARLAGTVSSGASLFWFGSRVQSIPSNGSTQDETRERTTCPLVIARHCRVSSGASLTERGSVVPIQTHRPDPISDSYAYVVRGCVHLCPVFSPPDHYACMDPVCATYRSNGFL
jgi:hypothetical protein